MQGQTGVGVPHEILHQVVGVLLLVHEHQDAAILLVQAQQLQQLEELLVFLEDDLQYM